MASFGEQYPNPWWCGYETFWVLFRTYLGYLNPNQGRFDPKASYGLACQLVLIGNSNPLRRGSWFTCPFAWKFIWFKVGPDNHPYGDFKVHRSWNHVCIKALAFWVLDLSFGSELKSLVLGLWLVSLVHLLLDHLIQKILSS